MFKFAQTEQEMVPPIFTLTEKRYDRVCSSSFLYSRHHCLIAAPYEGYKSPDLPSLAAL